MPTRPTTQREVIALDLSASRAKDGMDYSVLVDGKYGAYGVVFPDLPGCVAMGKTVDEALANAADVLRDCFEVSEDQGEIVPPPRPLEELLSDYEVAGALSRGASLALVSLDHGARGR